MARPRLRMSPQAVALTSLIAMTKMTDVLVRKGLVTREEATDWLEEAADDLERAADGGALILSNEQAAALLREMAKARRDRP